MPVASVVSLRQWFPAKELGLVYGIWSAAHSIGEGITFLVTPRLVRPLDVSPGNAVFSDQLAELEIAVNGKGVVGDAVRRPNILYRILLGLLPF